MRTSARLTEERIALSPPERNGLNLQMLELDHMIIDDEKRIALCPPERNDLSSQ